MLQVSPPIFCDTGPYSRSPVYISCQGCMASMEVAFQPLKKLPWKLVSLKLSCSVKILFAVSGRCLNSFVEVTAGTSTEATTCYHGPCSTSLEVAAISMAGSRTEVGAGFRRTAFRAAPMEVESGFHGSRTFFHGSG